LNAQSHIRYSLPSCRNLVYRHDRYTSAVNSPNLAKRSWPYGMKWQVFASTRLRLPRKNHNETWLRSNHFQQAHDLELAILDLLTESVTDRTWEAYKPASCTRMLESPAERKKLYIDFL
jgi:hypothetical protein